MFDLDDYLIGSDETSICPPPCWRETLRSLTLLRWGDWPWLVSLLLTPQGKIEMRKMSNKGRWYCIVITVRVLLPRQRSLLSGQGRGAVWLWRSPGSQEQAGQVVGCISCSPVSPGLDVTTCSVTTSSPSQTPRRPSGSTLTQCRLEAVLVSTSFRT